MIYIYILIAVQLLNGLFFWKGYEKAGYKGWQAFVPFYNTVIFHRTPLVVGIPTLPTRDRQHYGNSDELRVATRIWLPPKTLHPLISCYPWAFHCLSDVPTKSSICRKRL